MGWTPWQTHPGAHRGGVGRPPPGPHRSPLARSDGRRARALARLVAGGRHRRAGGAAARGPRRDPGARGARSAGLVSRILPEWEPVRSRPQRNAYHRFTVDRHLWEAAANAADLVDRVARPDLLVLGALFHDLGKGYPGDHTEVGMELCAGSVPASAWRRHRHRRAGAMVEHHLLLPDVAMRRDLTDHATISAVADAVGDVETLDLLHALTEADSKATGAVGVELVEGGAGPGPRRPRPPRARRWRRPRGHLAAVPRRRHPRPDGGRRGRRDRGRRPHHHREPRPARHVQPPRRRAGAARARRAGRPGALRRVASRPPHDGGVAVPGGGAPRRHRLGARGAGPPPCRGGGLAIEARLAERARTYRRRRATQAAAPGPPRLEFHDGASSNATVIEVRAPTKIGVLYRITKALAELGLDIRHATVQTIGMEVVDTFYVRSVVRCSS
jgi:[protein-PII] uridylyltransferase